MARLKSALLYGFSISCIYLISAISPVYAAQFSQSLDILYAFDDAGNVHVTKKITLINLQDNYYPTEYVLAIPEDATHITAFDELGKAAVAINTLENGKHAVVQLGKSNIGTSTTTELAISYDSRQLAKKINRAWQVAIPPTTSSESIADIQVSVVLPEQWGIPVHIEPPSKQPLHWTMHELSQKEILISYLKDPPPTPTDIALSLPTKQHTFPPYTGIALGLIMLVVAYYGAKSIHFM